MIFRSKPIDYEWGYTDGVASATWGLSSSTPAGGSLVELVAPAIKDNHGNLNASKLIPRGVGMWFTPRGNLPDHFPQMNSKNRK